MMGSPDLYWGWHMFTHESHICCRREASVMHNLEDLIGGHIMGAGPFLVAWRKDQTFLLVAYHLFFLEILNYSLSLYIYIYVYIYINTYVCAYMWTWKEMAGTRPGIWDQWFCISFEQGIFRGQEVPRSQISYALAIHTVLEQSVYVKNLITTVLYQLQPPKSNWPFWCVPIQAISKVKKNWARSIWMFERMWRQPPIFFEPGISCQVGIDASKAVHFLGQLFSFSNGVFSCLLVELRAFSIDHRSLLEV